MGNQKYSAKFKFQVVLEALTSDKTDAEIARAYDVHPVTLSNWKSEHRENGAKVVWRGRRDQPTPGQG